MVSSQFAITMERSAEYCVWIWLSSTDQNRWNMSVVSYLQRRLWNPNLLQKPPVFLHHNSFFKWSHCRFFCRVTDKTHEATRKFFNIIRRICNRSEYDRIFNTFSLYFTQHCFPPFLSLDQFFLLCLCQHEFHLFCNRLHHKYLPKLTTLMDCDCHPVN